MPPLGRLWCWVWEELCTCCSAGRDGESCQWLVADIMAVDQEAGQVLHSIKLPFQHFLSPLTNQVAGCKANILLNTAQLADRFSDVTLLLRGQKRGFLHFSDTTRSRKVTKIASEFQEDRFLLLLLFYGDPKWAVMACEQTVSSLDHCSSMFDRVKAKTKLVFTQPFILTSWT